MLRLIVNKKHERNDDDLIFYYFKDYLLSP
jgi:hypothetical protein